MKPSLCEASQGPKSVRGLRSLMVPAWLERMVSSQVTAESARFSQVPARRRGRWLALSTKGSCCFSLAAARGVARA
ncbi:MAG: hypothetical protein M3Y33_14265, partial [Actinomycetota bacterium]|nr:hypothetical protein [Actinomycetota bacterium]